MKINASYPKCKLDETEAVNEVIKTLMTSYLESLPLVGDRLKQVESQLILIMKNYDRAFLKRPAVILRWNSYLCMLEVNYKFTYKGIKTRGQIKFYES